MSTRARECSMTDNKPFRYQFSLGLKFPLLEKDVLALSIISLYLKALQMGSTLPSLRSPTSGWPTGAQHCDI